MAGQESNSSLNALFKSISPLVKQLDERRTRATSLSDLFDDDVTAWRQELVQACEDAFFDDQDCISAKPRELMWRKGYYDTISMAKRFVHKHQKSQAALGNKNKTTTIADIEGMDQLCSFIEEGILRLKKIIIRIEKEYNLDLQYIVDFTLFENGEVELPLESTEIPINKKITSLEIINFALESIHALIVSLGDLHRYYLDFNLHQQFNGGITNELTAQFYAEAFKLNPKIGMPQNQLGTLWIGRNYNLDSVYHYLYSLVCAKPFELSEDNVVKIFQQGAAYLEALVMPEEYQVNLRDFMARFLLVVDIFFFDKNVPTFNDLCRFLLCDLNSMLKQRRTDDDSPVLDQDMLFKLTSILFFCMRKLKRSNSPKVYQLNAFLAAVCDQFVESCNANFKEFFEAHAVENEEYQERYQQVFSLFSNNNNNNNIDGRREGRKVNGNSKEGELLLSVDDQVKTRGRVNTNGHRNSNNGLSGTSQEASCYGASSNDQKSSADDRAGKRTPLTGASSNGEGKDDRRAMKSTNGTSEGTGKKRVMKYRRRRRRSTYSSDSDLTSNFDSDSEKDEDEDSDYSDDDSEEEEEYNSSAENVDPEVTLVGNGNGFNGTLVQNGINDDFEDNDSDVIIEEETTVMVQKNGNKGSTYYPVDTSKETNHYGQDLEEQLGELHIRDGEEDEQGQDQGNIKKDTRVRQKVGLVKYDPNLLLHFVDTEPTIRALKVLFDWLMDNKEIIWECYQSNPAFVDKMMTLLNAVNVNIFTRRVFFDRQLLTVDGLREDIRCLFDARAKLPIAEDLLLKHFGEFTRAQANLDWEIAAQLKVTPMEENLLRVVKLKNFGFFICDRRKFGYAFRNCHFEEVDTEQMRKRKNAKKVEKRDGRDRQQQQPKRNGWCSGGSGSGETRRERRRRQRAMMWKEEIVGDNDGGGGGGRRRDRKGQSNGQQRERRTDLENGRQQTRRNGGGQRGSQREEGNGDTRKAQGVMSREKEMLKKGELMGKLWLRNEVKNLESKARGPKGMNLLTPYVVVDTKAFMQHLSIVKHFVSMKKFIVLIPTEVLAELDALKTSHDRARECIRWLDRTISNGSPFLKTQEIKEKLPIPDYVKPQRQGMRTETTSFVEIAEFCHYLAKKHEIDGQSADVLTLLTGDDLMHKVTADEYCTDFASILRSIPIKFDRIDKFYGKLIKK